MAQGPIDAHFASPVYSPLISQTTVPAASRANAIILWSQRMLQTMSATAVAEASAFNLDLRLIANVQAHAGAQCHEAAGLIFAYHLCVDVCRDAFGTDE